MTIRSWFSSFFASPQQQDRPRPDPRPQGRPAVDLPPGSTPIESIFDMQQIAGTSHHIGNMSRIFETPGDELVTANLQTGARLGCNHFVYSVEPRQTPAGLQPGIAGACHFCLLGTIEALEQGLISQQEAELLPLYCSDCASMCRSCHRPNVCIGHTYLYDIGDGHMLIVCPDCYLAAERTNTIRRVITGLVYPFLDMKQLSR